ncbi:MAG: hypothetical protein FCKEOINB_01876 [Nitrosomonas sp.]|nr:hypothetical protein [Nitrosomonas sp.]
MTMISGIYKKAYTPIDTSHKAVIRRGMVAVLPGSGSWSGDPGGRFGEPGE